MTAVIRLSGTHGIRAVRLRIRHQYNKESAVCTKRTHDLFAAGAGKKSSAREEKSDRKEKSDDEADRRPDDTPEAGDPETIKRRQQIDLPP